MTDTEARTPDPNWYERIVRDLEGVAADPPMEARRIVTEWGEFLIAGPLRLTEADSPLGHGTPVPEDAELPSGDARIEALCAACGHDRRCHSSGGMCDGNGTECYCVRFPDATDFARIEALAAPLHVCPACGGSGLAAALNVESIGLSAEQTAILREHLDSRQQTIAEFFGDVLMDLGLGRASGKEYPPAMTARG